MAGDVTWDPATDLFYYTGGSLSGDQWIYDDRYDWIYFGADGVSLSYCYNKIYPLKVGPDGVTYVFDPHIEYLNKIRGNGTISYARFGATEAQMAGKYKKIVAIKDTYNR